MSMNPAAGDPCLQCTPSNCSLDLPISKLEQKFLMGIKTLSEALMDAAPHHSVLKAQLCFSPAVSRQQSGPGTNDGTLP